MRTLIASFLALFSVATPVCASCAQRDFAGDWRVYKIIAPSVGPAYWVRCQLKIGSRGLIQDTSCNTSNGSTVTLKNGRVTLASADSCTFIGGFELQGVKYTIADMTLAQDKLTAEGVGTAAIEKVEIIHESFTRTR
jgi:hypothetical protein